MINEEFLNLEQTPAENGLLKFHANQEQIGTAYDDLPDCISGVLLTLLSQQNQFSDVTPQQKLVRKEIVFLQKRARLRKAPAVNLVSEGMASDW